MENVDTAKCDRVLNEKLQAHFEVNCDSSLVALYVEEVETNFCVLIFAVNAR